ncbi:MAG: pseudouridine synthase [marine bacterium B5-7]|nr:MAG: pseudouridine synthase [marine bacterium B5-7]
MSVQYITITADQARQRLDNFLRTQLKGVPKTHFYKIIRKGEVRVNKKRIKPEYKLQPGDVVRIPPVRVAEKIELKGVPDALARTLKENILLETDDFFVLDKPAGLSVHGGSEQPFGVIEAMRVIRKDCSFLDLAHRLDRDTSGCLLLAKNRVALRELHEAMRNNKVTKRYQVLVKGKWPAHLKTVTVPLLPYQEVGGEKIVLVSEEGKFSKTTFKILKYNAETTLLEATLHTGRMHQIRVHCAHSGHSIVGDRKYGDKAFSRAQGIRRLCLHAKELSFVLGGERYNVESESPL